MRPTYGSLAEEDDGYGTTMGVANGELDADRLEAQIMNSKPPTPTPTAAPNKLTNKSVVALGSMGLFLLTFGTFFLVINNRSGSGSGSWSSASSEGVFSSSAAAVSSSSSSSAEGDDGNIVHVTFTDDGASDDASTSQTMEFSIARCNYTVIDFFSGSSSSPLLTYKILENHFGVLEPYAPMQLYMIKDLSARTLSEDSSGGHKQVVTYKYSITDPNGDTLPEATDLVAYAEENDGVSSSFTIPCTPGDVYTINLERFSGADSTSTTSGTLLCKYVRREFRTLTSDDLTKTMDAMYTMWTYTTKKGQKKYGSDFFDADFFADLHYYNAGFRDSDHIHEGLGFLPQHIKMTNMFEMAMQAVDPSISMFYWDFTIDTVAGNTVYNTPYFSASTFGNIPQPKNSTAGWSYKYDSLEDAKIPDGRWAGLKAQVNDKYPELSQAFGYMRAPWNMNPSEYISRFSIGPPFVNLPGCGNYKEWFEEKDFEASMKEAAYGPHSTTHTAIGGVYGCDVLDDFRDQGMILDASLKNQQSICLKWGFFIKEYYRGNYLTPNSDCDGESEESCFTCNSESLDDMLDMMKSSALKNYVPSDASTEVWEKWRDFVCSGASHKIFVGDHLESASPADPSFWPIHPTQERLLQARYSNGGFWDFDWPVMGSAGDYVCNHFECYDDDTLELLVGNTSCCYGHYEYDRLYYPGDRSKTLGDTNHKVLKATDSSSIEYSMPYIYDSFSWDHCGDLFEIENLAEMLDAKAASLDSAGEPLVGLAGDSIADIASSAGSESEESGTTSPDTKGYSTVLASGSRQSARGSQTDTAGESSEPETGVSSITVTSADSKGYSTVLASDSRWTGRAKGWGDLDDDGLPDNRH